MKRDLQGHTVPIVIEGEELQAFVPNPLPPVIHRFVRRQISPIFLTAHSLP